MVWAVELIEASFTYRSWCGIKGFLQKTDDEKSGISLTFGFKGYCIWVYPNRDSSPFHAFGI